MAKTNYSYEKRQREIAKKKQKEAKQARKRAVREDGSQDEASHASGDGS